ncbi:MAG: class I SAM-dependent methyltransferase [Pseudohongiellaceae bacterium]
MTHLNLEASALLVRHITLLKALEISHGVLDLACGSGRNGRYLLSRGLPVVFADIDGEKLASLSAVEVSDPAMVTLWEVDFESKADDPLAGKTFDAIMVFNYLHRALIDRIKQAVRPGGLVFYETFTEQQRRFGRPGNPDFLLKPDELKAWFETWQIIHYEERERAYPPSHVASLVARKP